MFSIDLPEVEIIPGTDAGSKYLVIAKAEKLKLAVKPIVVPYPRPDLLDEKTKKGDVSLMDLAYIHMGCRIRVEPDGRGGDLTKAGTVFGIPNFRDREGKPHVSVNVGIAVNNAHYPPEAFRQAVVKFEILETLATSIVAMLTKAGVKPLVGHDMLGEYFKIEFEKLLPEPVPVTFIKHGLELHFFEEEK